MQAFDLCCQLNRRKPSAIEATTELYGQRGADAGCQGSVDRRCIDDRQQRGCREIGRQQPLEDGIAIARSATCRGVRAVRKNCQASARLGLLDGIIEGHQVRLKQCSVIPHELGNRGGLAECSRFVVIQCYKCIGLQVGNIGKCVADNNTGSQPSLRRFQLLADLDRITESARGRD